MRTPIVVAFSLVLTSSVGADDGSWTQDAGYLSSGGALYSEKSSVALEQEYLELTDNAGGVRAIFQFKNTDAQPTVVEAGFPIDVKFEAQRVEPEDGPPLLVVDPSLSPLFEALNLPTSPWEVTDEDGRSDGPKMTVAVANYPQGRREYPAAALAAAFGLVVKQDGAALTFSSCVVDFGTAPGVITLHFRHQLKFAANATSRVEVTYRQSVLVEEDHEPTAMPPYTRSQYRWNYVLETAASWKGALGQLLLAVPEQAAAPLPSPWQDLGVVNQRHYYLARQWEPGSGANLSIEWEERQEDSRFLWDRDVETEAPEPPQGVRFLSATSSIADKADAYLSQGIWKNAPFDGARLFDGLPETAWAVRTKTSGVGEAVRFHLDAKRYGLTVYNGYQRSAVDYPPKKTWSFFERNNRVKTLDLYRERDGLLVRRLSLQDQREGQFFGVDLEPGDYRLVIVDVYRGSQWNDTCLGEVEFASKPVVVPDAAALKALAGQDFFREFLPR